MRREQQLRRGVRQHVPVADNNLVGSIIIELWADFSTGYSTSRQIGAAGIKVLEKGRLFMQATKCQHSQPR